MERDTTRSLSRVLEEIRDCKEADRFIDEHAARDSFTAYINEKMADKGRTPAEVRDASGISKNYFYNILNGDRITEKLSGLSSLRERPLYIRGTSVT